MIEKFILSISCDISQITNVFVDIFVNKLYDNLSTNSMTICQQIAELVIAKSSILHFMTSFKNVFLRSSLALNLKKLDRWTIARRQSGACDINPGYWLGSSCSIFIFLLHFYNFFLVFFSFLSWYWFFRLILFFCHFVIFGFFLNIYVALFTELSTETVTEKNTKAIIATSVSIRDSTTADFMNMITNYIYPATTIPELFSTSSEDANTAITTSITERQSQATSGSVNVVNESSSRK